MPSVSYILASIALAGLVTFSLRALPFAALKPLRESRFIGAMAAWMPVGILAILAASTFLSTAADAPDRLWQASLAALVTATVHLTCGRRTLVSVGAGTIVYVALVNLV